MDNLDYVLMNWFTIEENQWRWICADYWCSFSIICEW